MPEIKIKPTHSKENWTGWYDTIKDLVPRLRKVNLTGKQLEAISLRSREKRVLVDSDNSSKYKTREEDEPIFTITKGFSSPKIIIERVGARGRNKIRDENNPIWTLKASLGTDGKGASREKVIDIEIDGGVKTLNVQCLARLQSFPDDYKFSNKVKLDVHIIGNSVPPLLINVICASIINSLDDDMRIRLD
jgi:DNA (cytosine-5)-methyltransferase 1